MAHQTFELYKNSAHFTHDITARHKEIASLKLAFVVPGTRCWLGFRSYVTVEQIYLSARINSIKIKVV